MKWVLSYTIGMCRVSGGSLVPHPCVPVAKGSSVPIALNGPDKQCSHSLGSGSNKQYP